MATTASPRSPPKRPSSVSMSPPPGKSAITKGASARSAVPARVNGAVNTPTRRNSIRSATPPSVNGTETKESLATALKRETELKEQLLVQLENKEQAVLSVTKENDQLSSALNSAETRLSELYADQGRAEEEMAARIEVIDKLRTQARELEKEKRDMQRRYNEQTSTFEAERQAFYDNEQHLKSRIQSLTQARKQHAVPTLAPEYESEAELDEEEEQVTPPKQDFDDPESEPAEMTALKLELSTLSTSYTSMQNTLILLQTQLVDLKRVNNELQEENESYNILLREKTLNGEFDIYKQVGGTASSSNSDQGDEEEPVNRPKEEDSASLRSTSRSLLDPVDETPEGGEMDPELLFDADHTDMREAESASRRPTRHGRKRGASSASHSPTGAPRGESLANLPITGPGLDLAAELGRAENKDILEGNPVDEQDHSIVNKDKRDNKRRPTDRKLSLDVGGSRDNGTSPGPDVDALRTEVKALKDANKALSLYASRIIDRIISQEGFEHVLAIDYEKDSLPKSPAPPSGVKSPPQAASKPRPQSISISRSSSTQSPLMSPTERLTTFESISTPKTATPATAKSSRRSMSFDWNGFSLFGGNSEKKPESNLRPLTLKPGAPLVPGARKLDTQEDDEDRKERERLAATMKLMGIDKPPAPPSPPVLERTPSTNSIPSATPVTANPRFSFFRRASMHTPAASSESSSIRSGVGMDSSQTNLTQEALEQAEAENSLAALDAHEKNLSADMAKGSGGGFTELPTRKSRRSAGGSGSGSTVWSAGMSKATDED